MDTIASRIKGVLAKGPATGMDVSIALGMDSCRVNTNLCGMYRSGQVTRSRYFQTSFAGRRKVWLYALPGDQANRPSSKMDVAEFRSAPEFEERLCPTCLAKGDPDPYWPVDRDSWPVLHGRFVFTQCKACKAEAMVEYRARQAA